MYDQPSSFRGYLLLIFIFGVSLLTNLSGLLGDWKPLLNRCQCISYNQLLYQHTEIQANRIFESYTLEKRASRMAALNLASKETQKEIFPSNVVNHHEATGLLQVRSIKNNNTNVYSKLYLL
jgi:hypothetical protein